MSRETNKNAGSELRRAMGQDDEASWLESPCYTAYIDEYYYHSIGNRRILNASDRVILCSHVFMLSGIETATERMVKFALDLGYVHKRFRNLHPSCSLRRTTKKQRTPYPLQIAYSPNAEFLPEHPEDVRLSRWTPTAQKLWKNFTVSNKEAATPRPKTR